MFHSVNDIKIPIDTENVIIVLQTDNHKRIKIIYKGKTLKEKSRADAKRSYRLIELNLYDGQISYIDSNKKYSGEFLMNVGFNSNVNSNRSSVVNKIEAI